jgi:hypothetical protein
MNDLKSHLENVHKMTLDMESINRLAYKFVKYIINHNNINENTNDLVVNKIVNNLINNLFTRT